ncbi:MAG: SUMF1/EgtB/PvdO family nonheme iron enzyme [Chloroflexi bacterium]|nr:SUMF1/EgtB/PvdO family nonheme iron enzyme [Chloroflexota bacterium]
MPQRELWSTICLPLNVWRQGQPIQRRVLRGGSFNNNSRNARCACRNRNNPDNLNNNIGFRVAASHFSPVQVTQDIVLRCDFRRKCSTPTRRKPRQNRRESAVAPWLGVFRLHQWAVEALRQIQRDSRFGGSAIPA